MSIIQGTLRGHAPTLSYEDWTALAHCAAVDPEIFHMEGTGPTHVTATEHAIEICEHCPIQATCLQWALDHDESGIWGGTTTKQRTMIRRRQHREKRKAA